MVRVTNGVRTATKAVPAALFLNEIAGLTCQFIQHTDPRFPLVYFTVLSAALTAVTVAVGWCWPRLRWLPPMRIAAAVGVVLSAVVFACVIAPATPTGTWFQPTDDYWVRTATVLMHGTAPVLVVIDTALRPAWRRLGAWLMAAAAWPVAYIVVVAVLVAAGGLTQPYPFLQPSKMGWGVVAGAVAVMSALIVVITASLYAVQWAARKGTAQDRPGPRSHS